MGNIFDGEFVFVLKQTYWNCRLAAAEFRFVYELFLYHGSETRQSVVKVSKSIVLRIPNKGPFTQHHARIHVSLTHYVQTGIRLIT